MSEQPDSQELAQAIRNLNHLLNKADASALHQLETIEKALYGKLDPILIKQLVRDVENYEFDSAVETLLQIAAKLSINLDTDQIRSNT